MSHNDEMAELCEGIAQVLEEKGHTTKTYYNNLGNVCLLGAGRLAQGLRTTVSTAALSDADRDTAEALGFSQPQKVIEYNDGHIKRTSKMVIVPKPMKAFFTEDIELTVIEPSYAVREVIEETVYPPIGKQQAIDLAMERAKYWRNQ